MQVGQASDSRAVASAAITPEPQAAIQASGEDALDQFARESQQGSSRFTADGPASQLLDEGRALGRSWRMSDFHIQKRIGGGRLSTVYAAHTRSSRTPVALKCYERAKMDSFSERQVYNEITIHSRLHHPSIASFYGSFEDEGLIVIVLEHADTDVFKLCQKLGGKMGEKQAVTEVLQPVIRGLEYLHQRCIIHRDIKPENLLAFAGGEVKITDFGLAIDQQVQRPCTRLGTTDYMAPELVRVQPDAWQTGESAYNEAVDCWAVGVLAYELLAGRAPFEGSNKEMTYYQIEHGTLFIPSSWSRPAREFIQQGLERDIAKRPDVGQLAQHPWVAVNTEPTPRRMKRMNSDLGLAQLSLEDSPIGSAGARGLVRVNTHASGLADLASHYKSSSGTSPSHASGGAGARPGTTIAKSASFKSGAAPRTAVASSGTSTRRQRLGLPSRRFSAANGSPAPGEGGGYSPVQAANRQNELSR